jgi:hypothetical protein
MRFAEGYKRKAVLGEVEDAFISYEQGFSAAILVGRCPT